MSGLSAAARASIPIVGFVDVSGSIQASGDYTLTASAANVKILFFTLSNVSVTLSNSSGLASAIGRS